MTDNDFNFYVYLKRKFQKLSIQYCLLLGNRKVFKISKSASRNSSKQLSKFFFQERKTCGNFVNFLHYITGDYTFR